MFFVLLAALVFFAVFFLDKMQLWSILMSGKELKAPMVWGPLMKWIWRLVDHTEVGFSTIMFFWAFFHLMILAFVFEKVKIGPAIDKSGVAPTIIVALAMAAFYGQLYLRRRKVV